MLETLEKDNYDKGIYAKAFCDVIFGNQTLMSADSADKYMRAYVKELRDAAAKAAKEEEKRLAEELLPHFPSLSEAKIYDAVEKAWAEQEKLREKNMFQLYIKKKGGFAPNLKGEYQDIESARAAAKKAPFTRFLLGKPNETLLTPKDV